MPSDTVVRSLMCTQWPVNKKKINKKKNLIIHCSEWKYNMENWGKVRRRGQERNRKNEDRLEVEWVLILRLVDPNHLHSGCKSLLITVQFLLHHWVNFNVRIVLECGARYRKMASISTQTGNLRWAHFKMCYLNR